MRTNSWEDLNLDGNIKMDFKERGREDVEQNNLAQDKDNGWDLVNTINERLSSIKFW
jgi:hypothetical protein